MLIKGLPIDALTSLAMRRSSVNWERPMHVFFCIADHYEPMLGNAPLPLQRERIDRWINQYPKMYAGVKDCWGRSPQHTFFYPAEEYTPEHIDKLAILCKAGYGDVEVHLHHDNDTAENLRQTLNSFTESLVNDHGLLHRDESGKISYGFVHGNWALDNSRPDGRWCGVKNELSILTETGCYADFTLPSAPSATQTRITNSIYYARGKDGESKSHDQGQPACVEGKPPEKSLLMIQGPLGLDWSRRKYGLLPKLENSELHGSFPPTQSRLLQWLKAGVQVEGRPDWYFIKLHTHGAKEFNADMLLGQPMLNFHTSLAQLQKNCPNFSYYYVTAWEMALLVHQAEQGIKVPQFDPLNKSN